MHGKERPAREMLPEEKLPKDATKCALSAYYAAPKARTELQTM